MLEILLLSFPSPVLNQVLEGETSQLMKRWRTSLAIFEFGYFDELMGFSFLTALPPKIGDLLYWFRAS